MKDEGKYSQNENKNIWGKQTRKSWKEEMDPIILHLHLKAQRLPISFEMIGTKEKPCWVCLSEFDDYKWCFEMKMSPRALSMSKIKINDISQPVWVVPGFPVQTRIPKSRRRSGWCRWEPQTPCRWCSEGDGKTSSCSVRAAAASPPPRE